MKIARPHDKKIERDRRKLVRQFGLAGVTLLALAPLLGAGPKHLHRRPSRHQPNPQAGKTSSAESRVLALPDAAGQMSSFSSAKALPAPIAASLPVPPARSDKTSGVESTPATRIQPGIPPPPVADKLPIEELENNEASVAQPVAPPKWTQGVVIWRGNTKRKEIALTFDDGPHPPFTQRLLRLLQQENVRATFFLVGKKLDKCPELARAMVQNGHEVANHTYNHVNLGKIDVAAVQHEIWLANASIRNACGQSPVCFRPPGGHHEPNVLQAANNMKMKTLLWTDDPADFARPGESVIEERLISHVRSGAVILLHDGVEQTLNILPDLIARLRREGYRFVTTSEMAAHIKSGKQWPI